MTMPPKRTCPNDGAAMVVTWDEPMGISFVCPVCQIERSHDDFHKKNEVDRIHERKNNRLPDKDSASGA